MGLGTPASRSSSSGDSLSPEQQTYITGVVSEQLGLRGTQSPLDQYITDYVNSEVAVGMGRLRTSYATLSPAACKTALDMYTNNEIPPEWATSTTSRIRQGLETTLQDQMSAFSTECKKPSSLATECEKTPVAASETTFKCKGDTCTIDLQDKILVVNGNMVVGDTLQVQSGLTANSIHGLQMVSTDQCKYTCNDRSPAPSPG